MAEGARNFCVFVSSPGDTRFERSRLERVIERLNGEFQGVARFNAIRWETEFYKAHETFQAQIPEAARCDIVVAVFRARLGTELPADFPRMQNGEAYPSGTAYEVLSAIEAAKDRGLPDVYVFRYPQPPSVQLDDPSRAEIEAQWGRLKAFFETWFRTAEGQFTAAFQTFTSTDEFEAQAEALLRRWLDEKVLHGRRAVWPVEIKGSPFRGLAAFGAKHTQVFFGRSRDVTKAVERLKDAAEKGCPFLLVDGASGSGKSSLVRAGLLPRLTAAGVVPGIDVWRVAVMRPGEVGGDPFAALAAALFLRSDDLPEFERGRPAALPELSDSDFHRPEQLAAQLGHADATALGPLVHALEAVAATERDSGGYDREVNAALLLVVDQLDELFGLGEEVRARFAKLIDLLARSKRVWIVATLRADLFDRFLREATLKQLKEDGASYDLAPPEAVALAEIVRGPAIAAGLDYERDDATGESLDELLLKDAERPDLLPLLQFTLNQLFEEAKQSAHPRLLSFSAYRALGGIAGAVDKEAEAALDTLGEAERLRLPRLLRELAAPARDDSVAAARVTFDIRPVPFAVAAYDETSARLVQSLVDRRILLSSSEGEEVTLRFAHARVLDSWQRAKAIVAENADFYRIRADVEEQRRKWEAAKHSRDLLIGRGRPLAEAESIMRRFPEEIPTETKNFIARSGRRARSAQVMTAIAAVLFALLAIAATVATYEARSAKGLAVAGLRAAQIAQSHSLVNVSNIRLGVGDAAQAIAIALEALPSDMEKQDRPYVPEAELALRTAYRYAQSNQFRTAWSGEADQPISTSSLNPDGRIVATAYGGMVRIIDRSLNSVVGSFDAGSAIWALHFLPNGQLVIATSTELRVYDIANKSDVMNVKTASNQSICGWDYDTTKTPQIRAYFANPATNFDHLEFLINFNSGIRQVGVGAGSCAPSGSDVAMIVVAYEKMFTAGIWKSTWTLTQASPLGVIIDNSGKLWFSNGGNFRVVAGSEHERFTWAFAAPDGHQVVAATADGQVDLFESATLQRVAHFDVPSNSLATLDVSADGQNVLIGYGNKAEMILTRSSASELRQLSSLPTAANLSICTNPEPARITSGPDGSPVVRLVDNVATLLASDGSSTDKATLGESGINIRDVAISPDGKYIVLLGEPQADATQKVLFVYAAASGNLLKRKQFAFGAGDQCARISPDQRFAVLVNNNGVVIDNFETGKAVHSFPFLASPTSPILGTAFSPRGGRFVNYNIDNTLTVFDAETGIFVDTVFLPAPAATGDARSVQFGFSSTGEDVLISRPDRSIGWTFVEAQDLINTARAYVPLCIPPALRASYYLTPEPPDWCIETGKAPYGTDDWKRWMAAKKAGKELPMPVIQ